MPGSPSISSDPLGRAIKMKCEPLEQASACSVDDHTDEALLTQFIRQHDEAAFAALVQRHGPMVRSVCRRVLRNPHDVEDAFQATFLVLVRKASSIGKPNLPANWLYGVAYRTAVNARSQAARRFRYESEAASMPRTEPGMDDAHEELLAVLDESLESLPDRYRAPLVLCYLEGKTNEEAARLIGCPPGSMSTLLSRGRAFLRDRLTGRYRELLAGFFTAMLVQQARTATVPPLLAGQTVQAAVGLVRGEALGIKLVSPSVGTLVSDTVKGMTLSQLRTGGKVLLALGTALLGVTLVSSTMAGGNQPPPAGPSATSTPAKSAPVEPPPRFVPLERPAGCAH
jgi:RNA polymerase sigma factor (sigma-70 family)